MQIIINQKTKLPEIQMESEDISDGEHIMLMLESEGWKRFLVYIAMSRKALEDYGKRVSRLPAADTKISSAMAWARLDGFDHIQSVVERILMQAEQLKSNPVKGAANEPRYNDE